MTDDRVDQKDAKHSVLEVFGLRLEVSNPRLAELLTMDASDALTSDVRELMSTDRRSVAEAIPDAVVAMPTAHSEAAERARREFRERADRLGGMLGFDVDSDGTWSSPTGIDIATRLAERPLTLAAAAHFVGEVAQKVADDADSSAVLFIVDDQQTADVFKVAIRQRRLHHLMRTVSIDRLEAVVELMRDGRLDHNGVLIMLAPIANIDVREILSVLHAEQGEGGDSAGVE